MANRLYNHKAKIKGIQPLKLKVAQPGMLITFRYSGKDILDKNPLIVLLSQEKNLVEGLNINYLSDFKVSNLFRYFSQSVGVDDVEPEGILSEGYTLINLPSYKRELGGNPLAKSESVVKMKRLYEQVIKKKILRTDDIYRSYDIKKMRVIKAVRYDI